MKKFSWIDGSSGQGPCIGKGCKRPYKRLYEQDGIARLKRSIRFGCVDDPCLNVKRPSQEMYRMFKTMKRSTTPEATKSLDPHEDSKDATGIAGKRENQKLYRMFKTIKRSEAAANDELYRMLEIVGKSNGGNYLNTNNDLNDSLHRHHNRMKKPSNDLYRSFKTMKKSDDLPAKLKILKKASNLYRYLKTMKRSTGLYRTLKTMKKSGNLYHIPEIMKKSSGTIYRTLKTIKKPSSSPSPPLIKVPLNNEIVPPQATPKRTKGKLYRILRTLKRDYKFPHDVLDLHGLTNLDDNIRRGPVLTRLFATSSGSILPSLQNNALHLDRKSDYHRALSMQAEPSNYYLRFSKDSNGKRLSNTRQHLTLRLNKRSAPFSKDLYMDNEEVKRLLEHSPLHSNKRQLDDIRKHLNLRLNKKDVDDIRTHLSLRLSKKDLENIRKHMSLRLNKKRSNSYDKLIRSNEQVFDDGMYRLVQGPSKKVEEPFGQKRGRADSKFEDSMKHLILRLSKKQAFTDPSDESIKDSMKHMALRLNKREDWSLDGPETNAKRIENISRHLKLRLSKRYNGLLSFLEREATNHQNEAKLSKVQEPKSVENEHGEDLINFISLLLNANGNKLDREGTQSTAEGEDNDQILHSLFLNEYPDIQPLLNSLYAEGLRGGKRAASDKYSVDAVERRNGFPLKMKYKILGKRIGKTEEAYRLLRTLRDY